MYLLIGDDDQIVDDDDEIDDMKSMMKLMI
jgi:hypothetical protein